MAHAFNYAMKHPVFVMREQLQRLEKGKWHVSNDYRDDDKGFSINLFNDVLYKDGHTYKFVMQEDKVTSWERLKALVEHHLKLDGLRTLVMVGCFFREGTEERVTHSCTFHCIRARNG